MDLITTLAIASALAALLSALYAASSARSARRSADLAQKDFNNRSQGLQAYLDDAIQWMQPDKQEIVAIACTLTNLASLPNTVIRTELILHEYANTGEPSRLMLSPIGADDPPDRMLKRFELPLNLAPRTTISGWLCFLVPRAFAKAKIIDKYELALHDSTGRRTTVETYLMHRVVYAQNKN